MMSTADRQLLTEISRLGDNTDQQQLVSEMFHKIPTKQSYPSYSKPISRDSFNRVVKRRETESVPNFKQVKPTKPADLDYMGIDELNIQQNTKATEESSKGFGHMSSQVSKSLISPHWLARMENKRADTTKHQTGLPKFLTKKESIHNF